MPEFIGGQPGSGIAGVDTSDTYQPAVTLGPSQDVTQITFNVVGNPAFVQFWKPVPGQPSKATLEPFERFYYANSYGVIATGVSGVRFRSYNAGQPATITAEMDFATDPVVFPGTVAGVNLTPSGGIIPPSQLETTDGVTDVVPTNELLIGSGITLTNPGDGVAELTAAGGLDVTDGVTTVNPATELEIGAGLVLTNPSPGVAEIAAVGTVASQVRAPTLDTPDASGFATPGVSTGAGFTNVRRVLPYLKHGGTGNWATSVRVPPDYASTPKIILSCVVNATSGNVVMTVGTASVANGGNEDTNYALETAQVVAVPGTALRRFDITFSVTGSTPAANSDLNIEIQRQGASGSDTCTADLAVWAVIFQYNPA